MIAYNKQFLDNSYIQEQTAAAFNKKFISADEYAKIQSTHPVGFYTPNLFIRIGLFLLTVIIACFSVGLMALITSAGQDMFTAVCIFSGLVSYIVLEFMVHGKNHFRSGVDDALIWLTLILIPTGINFAANNISASTNSFIIFLLAVWFCLRFADRIMALIAYGAWLSFLYYRILELVPSAKSLVPFILMVVSAAIYFGVTALYSREKCRHYRSCLTIMRIASLLGFYLAGNRYIVENLPYSGLARLALPTLSWNWLSWVLTIVIPPLYGYYGLRKKDPVFIWLGLALSAVTVVTIRYYYHFMAVEWAMTIAGLLLIGVAYALLRFLRTPRHGFIATEAESDKPPGETLAIESLALAETVAPAPATTGLKFGGGTSGGGGAGGQY